MKKAFLIIVSIISLTVHGQTGSQVRVANGILEGSRESSGIRTFKGVPYAQPPVKELRWKEPQPAKNWSGVRKATQFSAQPMQRYMWDDMFFRGEGKSEDCLYLNVWTPAKSAKEKLPVLVYFHGGGFVAGDGSEPRYDGESMAKLGIIVVTVNYRLGVFGFFAHPALTKESVHRSSGNYGLMDQHAALVWVNKNIGAFGGDPSRVTIGGESAGATSVCLQMASPLSKGLFAGAIGESGGAFGPSSTVPLAQGEKNGTAFTSSINATTLAELRALPAEKLLELSANAKFPCVVDGYFLPESPVKIYSTGKQMDIPLLAGWNSAETDYHAILGNQAPTVDAFKTFLAKEYGAKAEDAFRLYNAVDSNIKQVATDLASDRMSGYRTWKWIDLHSKTNGHPVYRFFFARKRPATSKEPDKVPESMGAAHASEIEYALGNLASNKTYVWTPDDHKVSSTMQLYLANFIKTGNPNGKGLATWYGLQSSIPKVMTIDVESRSFPEKGLRRYQFLDTVYFPD
ncbi:MAG: carboxylesterase [Citrobacter freundii]|nr:MAG: carboxylesterase [Citrobacter freundii]